LRPSQVALPRKGVNALHVNPPHHARVYPTATPTTLIIVLVTEVLVTTRTAEEKTIIVATTGEMTPGTTNLIGGTMTTGETMIVIATATVHATTATDAVSVETATETATAVVVTMKNGILTVGATNATIVTADAIAHLADVQGVGGGTIDRGHPGVVHVSLPQPPWARSLRLSVLKISLSLP
jgi:hypothetical protein